MLSRIYRKLWPELENMSLQNRLVGQGDVLTSLVACSVGHRGYWPGWSGLPTSQIILMNWQMFVLLGVLDHRLQPLELLHHCGAEERPLRQRGWIIGQRHLVVGNIPLRASGDLAAIIGQAGCILL